MDSKTREISTVIEIVSLDNNALIAAVEGGERVAVKAAIGKAQTVVSRQAAKEFLLKGKKQGLKTFMREVGATLSREGGSLLQVSDLQNQARSRGRHLKAADGRVAADAINNNATLITRDKKLRNFMNELDNLSRGF